jgi:hypothetical protein
MLNWLLRPRTEVERLATLLDALDTRVRQLERERIDLQMEHAERIDRLESLLRRMAVRAQRAESVRPVRETEQPDRVGVRPTAHRRATEEAPAQLSVLDFRQDLTRRGRA